MEINKIYNENCLITMAKMPDNFIDLIVTSPPYDNLRDYQGYEFEWVTYTTEELGSLAKAIGEYEYRNGTKEKIISEAIQVATLALKIAEMFEAEI